MASPRKQIENLQERIRTSTEISDPDRELLIEFSDQMDLLKSEYTDHRHDKLLRHCTIMAEEVGGLAEALEEKDVAEDLVRWINRNYENEYTNHDYRTALRVLAKRTVDGDELPDSVEWIPSGTSNSHDPVPNPAEMLDWDEDIIPMIEASKNSRDKALIAVAFDAGARSGELRELTVGDVNDHKHGLRIFVDGKTGQRDVTLIPSVPYLQRWLGDHPAAEDNTAPLWCKLSEPEELSYRGFRQIFELAAERAGVTKPTTPTNFRKSNASYLAQQGMSQPYIEDRQGRKRGSDATAHYVARFGGEAEDDYARMHGLEVEEEEPEPIGPLECPRCGKETPRHEPACVWCKQALDHAGAETLEEEEKKVRKAALRFAKENPEVLDDVQESRDFSELLEDNPELFGDAQDFLEKLSVE
jgi:integrase